MKKLTENVEDLLFVAGVVAFANGLYFVWPPLVLLYLGLVLKLGSAQAARRKNRKEIE